MWSLLMSLSFSHANTPGNINLIALNGDVIDANTFAGKSILFVNVASRCGYTKQYAGLQKLYEMHKDDGFMVVGVPCNQFGGQEPGSAEEIQTFCSNTYGVTFPILEKQAVNGDSRSDLYTKLVDSPVGAGKNIKWNFEKFLVDASGEVVARFPSSVGPQDEALSSAITAAKPKK